MYFKKIIFALSLISSLQVCVMFGMESSDLAKLSEVELIQGLIQNELTDLKSSKVSADNLSLEDTEKLFTQALDLCNGLKKDLTILFKVWSNIKRNPVFENELLHNIEVLRKQLLQYKLSKGTLGNGISKEKLVGLVSLLKLYKDVKKEITDNSKSSLLNKSSSYINKSLGFILWPVYQFSKFYTVKIATEFAMFLAIAGLINGAYSDNFVVGFTEPFITAIHGIWNVIFHSNMPISCDGSSGIMDYATCKTVEWLGKLV